MWLTNMPLFSWFGIILTMTIRYLLDQNNLAKKKKKKKRLYQTQAHQRVQVFCLQWAVWNVLGETKSERPNWLWVPFFFFFFFFFFLFLLNKWSEYTDWWHLVRKADTDVDSTVRNVYHLVRDFWINKSKNFK